MRATIIVTVALVSAASAAGGGTVRHIIVGSPGPDTLLGTKGPDLLVGGADHDELYGGRGSDVLRGGTGKDHVYGGDGPDVLVGGPRDDPWPVDPSFRRERLLGGAGNDVLVSHIGGAVVMGGPGNDTIDGRDSLTRCHVNAQSRALASGGPLCAQWLLAGSGDDVIRARDGNLDMIDCGGGRDVVAGLDLIDQGMSGCERVRR
jgi:Ca2+-binding RTX toxin-like protein